MSWDETRLIDPLTSLLNWVCASLGHSILKFLIVSNC